MPTIRVSEAVYTAIHERGGTFDSADDVIRGLFEEAGWDDLVVEPDVGADDDEFEEQVRQHFDLPETVTGDHVVAVARLLREGYELTEALDCRAEEAGVGRTTIRDACTRKIGFEGQGASEQFLDEMDSLLEDA